MILPIGKDGFSFRRLPWATFLIILICVLFLIVSQNHDRPIYEEIGRLEDEYIEFWFDHPYLPFNASYISDDKFYKIFDDVEKKLKSLIGKKIPKPGDKEYDAARDIVYEIFIDIDKEYQKRFRKKWGHYRQDPTFVRHFTHIFMHSDWR